MTAANKKDKIFYKVTFPDFWETAYETKNAYYKRVVRNAEKREEHIKSSVSSPFSDFFAYLNGGESSLPKKEEMSEKEWLERVWSTEQCWYFEEDISITEQCECYCTKDMDIWVCADCFESFKDSLGWIEKPSCELLDNK